MHSKKVDLKNKIAKLESQLNKIDLEINNLQNDNISANNITKPKPVKVKKESKPNPKLTPPNRGELKELCSKYAIEFGLKLGESLKDEDIVKVFDKITADGIKTTEGSVGSTLRDKLGYKKKKS